MSVNFEGVREVKSLPDSPLASTTEKKNGERSILCFFSLPAEEIDSVVNNRITTIGLNWQREVFAQVCRAQELASKRL